MISCKGRKWICRSQLDMQIEWAIYSYYTLFVWKLRLGTVCMKAEALHCFRNLRNVHKHQGCSLKQSLKISNRHNVKLYMWTFTITSVDNGNIKVTECISVYLDFIINHTHNSKLSTRFLANETLHSFWYTVSLKCFNDLTLLCIKSEIWIQHCMCRNGLATFMQWKALRGILHNMWNSTHVNYLVQKCIAYAVCVPFITWII